MRRQAQAAALDRGTGCGQQLLAAGDRQPVVADAAAEVEGAEHPVVTVRALERQELAPAAEEADLAAAQSRLGAAPGEECTDVVQGRIGVQLLDRYGEVEMVGRYRKPGLRLAEAG